MEDFHERIRVVEGGLHEIVRRTDRLEMRTDLLDTRTEEIDTMLKRMDAAWNQAIGAAKGANLAWEIIKIAASAGGGALLLRLLGGGPH